MKKNTKIMLIFLAFIAALLLCVFLFNLIIPTLITNGSLELASDLAKIREVEDGYVFTDITDWWGQPIKISCGSTEDGMAFIYTSISPGKDEISGTSDDLEKSVIDLNKSKMVGRYSAKKVKEFVKGWKEGEKEPSKFDTK
ncbi:MAG: hypothetical protein Q7K65_03515 [Candidatus Buchananbacteria bacterium]|nr:hypothetical protein [Candidatus Buchananbacteria bacterium]